jgi:L,D-peptidoglycan transpeptidase YkuD (ErfK/YbiS/YcfS/YnhG family)
VHGGWRQVRDGDCWDATGGRSTYNTLTRRTAANCTGDDEYLPSIPTAYSRAALIGANLGPDRSGDQPGEVAHAAAIFLHRFSYDVSGASTPTSGCVSLAGDDLDAVLTALVPGEAWFVIVAT